MSADTDGDGIADSDEITYGTDPLDLASTLADGDVNLDGTVNAADVLLAVRALLGADSLTYEQKLHADVAPLADGVPSPDGNFNPADLLVLQRKALGFN
ncbi:MAG: dockerin type I domain-containing protein [Pseudomonadota bacterium]